MSFACVAFKYAQFLLRGCIFHKQSEDLTARQREKTGRREREGGRGKVSAGLPDASRQVSVHTVL